MVQATTSGVCVLYMWHLPTGSLWFCWMILLLLPSMLATLIVLPSVQYIFLEGKNSIGKQYFAYRTPTQKCLIYHIMQLALIWLYIVIPNQYQTLNCIKVHTKMESYPLDGCTVRHLGFSIPWTTEVFRDPSSLATFICDSSLSELIQYRFLESQSRASPLTLTIPAKKKDMQKTTSIRSRSSLQ